MEVVKNKLNKMKAQSELSEERITRFESSLRVSKQHLEAALKEKELLHRKIEAVETQIIDADRKREDVIDKLRDLGRDTDTSESKRKVLENRELEGDLALTKLEDRLHTVRVKYNENLVQCEEGERRLATLQTEYKKVQQRRIEKETRAKQLGDDYEEKVKKLQNFERFQEDFTANEDRRDEHMKLLESYYKEAEERKEIGRRNLLRLRNLIEDSEDKIESMQSNTRIAKNDLKNAVAVVQDN